MWRHTTHLVQLFNILHLPITYILISPMTTINPSPPSLLFSSPLTSAIHLVPWVSSPPSPIRLQSSPLYPTHYPHHRLLCYPRSPPPFPPVDAGVETSAHGSGLPA